MQYLHPPLMNYTSHPIYNTHIYNNYELKNQTGIASCINYPNAIFTSRVMPKPTFVGPSLSQVDFDFRMKYPHWYYAKTTCQT